MAYLAPLQFRMVPLAEAWSRFQAIPCFDPGIESRSDRAANIFLYRTDAALGLVMTLRVLVSTV